MFENNMKYRWDQTAAICATIMNVNRDPKKCKLVEFSSLNPFRNKKKRRKPKITLGVKDSMSLLKKVFIEKQMPDNIEKMTVSE